MIRQHRYWILAAALAGAAIPALAEVTAQQVTESLQGQGYSDIDVAPVANGQIVTRATSADGVEVNVVYDSETGQVIAAEAARPGTVGGDGVTPGSNAGAATGDEGGASSDSGGTSGAEAGSPGSPDQSAGDEGASGGEDGAGGDQGSGNSG